MGKEKTDKNITVQIAQSFKGLRLAKSKIERLVREVCGRFGASKATVSIAILDDAGTRRINKKFLNHSGSTDVISFDLSSEGEEGKIFELVVNGERAVEQAALRGHRAQAELALYITHGLLHNLGFDDRTAKLAKKMHETEDEILREAGFGAVYKR